MCSLYFSWQHCVKDNSVTWRIENSLSSFEYAWSAGVHLAECDVVSSSPRFHCIWCRIKEICMAHSTCIFSTGSNEGWNHGPWCWWFLGRAVTLTFHDTSHLKLFWSLFVLLLSFSFLDFRHLALMSDITSKVKDLTLSDIMRMPLKHGSRPPLLVNMLRLAVAIGENAKLVIEVRSWHPNLSHAVLILFDIIISFTYNTWVTHLLAKIKPGNSEIVEPLMMLFNRHSALLSRVAVIMSFDLYIMQEIADRFALQSINNLAGSMLGVISEGKLSMSAFHEPTVRWSELQLRRTRAAPMQSVLYGTGAGGGNEVSIPKLLLLTAHREKSPHIKTSVKEGFNGLIQKLWPGSGIDGFYLEFEPEMLEPEGKAQMLKLAETYTVSVWMLKPRDPDSLWSSGW